MIQKNRHTLARVAVWLAILAVLLAAVSGLVGRNIVMAQTSYMFLAIVLLLFAIYMRLGTLAQK